MIIHALIVIAAIWAAITLISAIIIFVYIMYIIRTIDAYETRIDELADEIEAEQEQITQNLQNDHDYLNWLENSWHGGSPQR